jgi:hypothetical protein
MFHWGKEVLWGLEELMVAELGVGVGVDVTGVE